MYQIHVVEQSKSVKNNFLYQKHSSILIRHCVPFAKRLKDFKPLNPQTKKITKILIQQQISQIEFQQLCDLQVPSPQIKSIKTVGNFTFMYYGSTLDVYKCNPVQKMFYPTILRLERSNISSFDINIDQQLLIFFQNKTLFLCKLNLDSFDDLSEDGSFQIVKVATRSNIQVAEVDVSALCALLDQYAVVCIQSTVFVFDINKQLQLGFLKDQHASSSVVALDRCQHGVFLLTQEGNLYSLALENGFELINKYPIGWTATGISCSENLLITYSATKLSIFQSQPFSCLISQYDVQQKLKFELPISKIDIISNVQVSDMGNPVESLKMKENSYLIFQFRNDNCIDLSAVCMNTLAVTNIVQLDSAYQQQFSHILISAFQNDKYTYVMRQKDTTILVIDEIAMFQGEQTAVVDDLYPLSMLWEDGRQLLTDECKISLNQNVILTKISAQKEKQKADKKVNKPVMFGVSQPKSLISTKLEITTMHRIILDERARARQQSTPRKLPQISTDPLLKTCKFEGQCFSQYSCSQDYMAALTNQCSVHLFEKTMVRKFPIQLQTQPSSINLHTHSQFLLVSQKQGALLYRLSDTITKPIFDLKFHNSKFDSKVTQYQEPQLCQFLYSPFEDQGLFATNILDEVYLNYFKHQEDNDYQTFNIKAFHSFRTPVSLSVGCTFTNRFSPYLLAAYSGFDPQSKNPSLDVFDLIKQQPMFSLFANQNPFQRTITQIQVPDIPLVESNLFATFSIDQQKGNIAIFDLRQNSPIRVFQYNDCKKRNQNLSFMNQNQLLFSTEGGMGVYDISEGKIVNAGHYYASKSGRGSGGCQCFSVGSFDNKAVSGFGNQELCFWGNI